MTLVDERPKQKCPRCGHDVHKKWSCAQEYCPCDYHTDV